MWNRLLSGLSRWSLELDYEFDPQEDLLAPPHPASTTTNGRGDGALLQVGGSGSSGNAMTPREGEIELERRRRAGRVRSGSTRVEMGYASDFYSTGGHHQSQKRRSRHHISDENTNTNWSANSQHAGALNASAALSPVVLLDEEDLGLTQSLREFVLQLSAFRETWIDFPVDRLGDDYRRQFGTHKRDFFSGWRVRRWHSAHASDSDEEGKEGGEAAAAAASDIASAGEVPKTSTTFVPKLTEMQEMHAMEVLQAVPELAQLRFELCPREIEEEYFWSIYFALVASRVGDVVGTVRVTDDAADGLLCKQCTGEDGSGDTLFMYLAHNVYANRQEAKYKATKQAVLPQLLKNRDRTHRFWVTTVPQAGNESELRRTQSSAAEACARVRRGISDSDRDVAWLLLMSAYRASPQGEFPQFDIAFKNLLEKSRGEYEMAIDRVIDGKGALLFERIGSLLNPRYSAEDHFLEPRLGVGALQRILVSLGGAATIENMVALGSDPPTDEERDSSANENHAPSVHSPILHRKNNTGGTRDVQSGIVSAASVYPVLVLAPDIVSLLLLFLEEDLAYAVARRLFVDDGTRPRPLGLFTRYSLECFPVALWLLLEAHVPRLFIHLTDTLLLNPTHPDVADRLQPWFSRCFVSTMSIQVCLRILDCLLCPCTCTPGTDEQVCECDSGEVVLLEVALAFFSRVQDELLATDSRAGFWSKVGRLAHDWTDIESLVRVRKPERLALDGGELDVSRVFCHLPRLEVEDALARARTLLLPPLADASQLMAAACRGQGLGDVGVEEAMGCLWARLPPRLQLRAPQLLFRASEDGFNVGTMLNACATASPTVILVRLVGNPSVLGALLSVPWPPAYGSGPSTRAEGTAECIAFQLLPAASRSFFPWTPQCESAFLRATAQTGIRIGATALFLDKDLRHGSTGASATFGNLDPLVDGPSRDSSVQFEAADVEVFKVS